MYKNRVNDIDIDYHKRFLHITIYKTLNKRVNILVLYKYYYIAKYISYSFICKDFILC